MFIKRPDEIYSSILKYASSTNSFFNAISKFFKKCIEYEIIPYIGKQQLQYHYIKKLDTFKK